MDWAKLVVDLEGTGRSLTEIAGKMGLSVAALSDIKQGRSKCPRGMAAVRLHKLHADIFGEAPVSNEAQKAAA